MADYLENQDRLKKLKADFVSDFNAETEWREDKEEYGNFYDGDQLSDEEKTELDKRGQPPVVVNRVKPKLDAIFGIQQALSVDTKVFASGNRELEALAISEELRKIEDDSEFDEQEDQVFEDICIDGRGYYKITKEYDGVNGIDKVKHISNANVVLDKYTPEEDLRTGELRNCKRIHETVWKDLEDAQELFPHFKKELEDAIAHPELGSPMLADKLKEFDPDQYKQPGGTQGDPDLNEFLTFVDKKKKRIRLVQTWYRTPEVRKYLKYVGGTIEVTEQSDKEIDKMKAELEGAIAWTETNYKLNTATFVWNVILEEKKDVRPYDKDAKFPIILVPAYVSRGKVKKHYGLVKQMMDPQREVNKRRSKMLHLLNVNQTWFEEGAFEDENRARQESARPDGWIKYKPQFKIDRVRHEQLAQAQFQLLQESKNEIDTSGVNREIEGRSNASSGRDFQLRQQQAMQSIRKLFANLRAARKRVAAYLLDEILERNEQFASDQFGSVRKYDLVIEEAPDTINLMSETFESLVSLARGGLPVPMDMIIEASPLAANKKSEFLEKAQAQQQQQAQLAQLAQAGRGQPQ